MPINYSAANREAAITMPGGIEAVLTGFTATERLSEPFDITADVVITKNAAKLAKQLGGKVSIVLLKSYPGSHRYFHGLLWSTAEVGESAEGPLYRLTIRPWSSFLDMNCESRTYLEMDVAAIVKDVVARRSGISPKLTPKLGSYPKLDYCVQWQESDFDFVSRMFERYGIYYFFEHSQSDHTLVAVDDKLKHVANEELGKAIELVRQDVAARDDAVLWGFSRRNAVAPIKATVSDYDFRSANTKLKADKEGEKRDLLDSGGVSELYTHPGGFDSKDGRGSKIANQILEAARADSERAFAEGNVMAAAVGRTISILTSRGAAEKFLIVGTTHHCSGLDYRSGGEGAANLVVALELMPAGLQFRPAQKTPRPRIYGPQTAVVVGDGEIHCDEYGRIKVHFHWDRVRESGPGCSFWVRVAQAVAGAQWGNWSLPRVGQEVVVEFLHGDPDQPIVTGSVYNSVNKVPYGLPANKTRTTFKSRSSPGSSGFNELRMEDKAGSEEVFFNAEKDLNSIVDKGSETRTLNKGSRTTTIKEGDETMEVTKGKRTTTIFGNETLTVKSGNRSRTIEKGSETLAVKMGNRNASIDMGNDSLTVKMGNRTIKVNLGKHATEAMQSIELKCGMSSVKLEPAKITLNSLMVEIKGTIQVKTSGLMVESAGSVLNTVKAAIVMIN